MVVILGAIGVVLVVLVGEVVVLVVVVVVEHIVHKKGFNSGGNYCDIKKFEILRAYALGSMSHKNGESVGLNVDT